MSPENIETLATASPAETRKSAARGWTGAAWLGMAMDASGVEWTAIRERAESREITGQGRESAPPTADAPPGWKSMMSAETVLVMPATSALLRVVRLPSTDPAELRGMVELQVDEFSPFPSEQLAISCETLSSHEGQTQLLIAALRRDSIIQAVDQWMGPKARPRRVDLDLLVWWRLASTLPAPTGEERTLHLRCVAGTLWMVGVQDGHPILFRALPLPSEESAALEDLIGEAELALAALEQEWGARSCDLVIWDASGGSLALRLTEALGLNVRTARTAEDFRISQAAAMAALPSADVMAMNLALPEWGVARSQKLRLHKIFLVTAGVLLAWILAMGGLYAFVQIRAASLESLKKAVAKAQGPAADAESMERRIETLNGHLDQKHTALEILRIATIALPAEGRLTSFSYRKGKSLNMRLEVPSQYSPEDYVKKLRESDLFDQIRPGRISEKSTASGDISDFPVLGAWGEAKP